MPAGANDVELIFNDLSIHQQFHDVSLFRQAINRLMEMRRIVRSFGRELYCHRGTSNLLVNSTTSLFQELQSFSLEQKRVMLPWLSRQGPFWEDTHEHDFNEILECHDDIVTDTGVGEAAYRTMLGMDCRLVSLTPSQWDYSPITVRWLTNTTIAIDVNNYWDSPDLEAAVQSAEPPIMSWTRLEEVSRQRFLRLTFTQHSFDDLEGRPFVPGGAQRILNRLEVLDRLMGEVGNNGQLTAEGQHLYQNNFVGEKARFSDSSETEKHKFKQELTFQDPGGQLYVVYVGWKITI